MRTTTTLLAATVALAGHAVGHATFQDLWVNGKDQISYALYKR
jgi:hypothetical protein